MFKTIFVSRDKVSNVFLESGNILLKRRGITSCTSAIVKGVGGRIHIERNGNHSSSMCEVEFTPIHSDGKAGTPVRRKSFFINDDLEKRGINMPSRLEAFILDNVDQYLGVRPKAALDVAHGYCHGLTRDEDVFLSPFRYDSHGHAIISTDGEKIVALNQSSNFKPKDIVLSNSCSELEKNALEEALRVGFYDCDFKLGVTYCMRRLAWLAGEFLMDKLDEKFEVFILGSDMESQAFNADLIN